MSNDWELFDGDEDEDLMQMDLNFLFTPDTDDEDEDYLNLHEVLDVSGMVDDEDITPFMLSMGEDDDDEIMVDGTGTSLILSGEASTKYSLTHFVAANEVALVNDRSERVVTLLNMARSKQSEEEKIVRELYDFLEGPECVSIPGKTLIFRSDKYEKQGYFHYFLVNQFVALLTQHRDDTVALDYSHILEEVDNILKEERILLQPQQKMEMYIAISKFSQLAETLYRVLQSRDFSALEAQLFMNVCPPAVVTAFGYGCVCGNFVVQEDVVPLSTLIVKQVGRYEYLLMNNPVPCRECGRVLALPEKVVEILSSRIFDIIKAQEVAIKGYVVYRPPVEAIDAIIPTDLRYLFDFKNVDYLDVESYERRDKSEHYLTYVSLVNFWMKSEEKQFDLVEANINVAPEQTSGVIYTASRIENIFDNLDVSFDIKQDLISYSKTLIHYLDSIGCFCLTYESQAFYKYCELAGINRKPFPHEDAIEWILSNAWALVGLKSVIPPSFQRDDDIGLLPQYVHIFNYLYMLRVLAMSENTVEQANYSSWKNRPYTKESGDFVARLVRKSRNKSVVNRLVTSERDFKDKKNMFSADAFTCLYTLLNEIFEKTAEEELVYSDKFQDMISDALFMDYEEFYGISQSPKTKKYLIKPVYRFDDFIPAFKEFGCYLFISSISTKKYIERAKVLTHLIQQNKISKTFESSPIPVSNLKYLFKVKPKKPEEITEYLKQIIYMSDDLLPDELIEMREVLSKEEFLRVAAQSRDLIESDGRLRAQYPEVFK